MSRPKIHSYTWSDADEGKDPAFDARPAGPQWLKDKELRLWVTYPDARKHNHGKKKKAHKDRSKALKLWAVMAIETLERIDRFTYEVCLRRVYKGGERFLKVQITNDPNDQSDEAGVFSFVHPRPEKLDPLEQYLCMAAAKRIYDAIEETWPDADECPANEGNFESGQPPSVRLTASL
jgi:hypothetical protein